MRRGRTGTSPEVGRPSAHQVSRLVLASQGVRVNSVHPGLIKTPLTKQFPDDLIRIPLGRPGTPEEVANFVLFLASEQSSFATGAALVVDGGTVQGIPHKT